MVTARQKLLGRLSKPELYDLAENYVLLSPDIKFEQYPKDELVDRLSNHPKPTVKELRKLLGKVEKTHSEGLRQIRKVLDDELLARYTATKGQFQHYYPDILFKMTKARNSSRDRWVAVEYINSRSSLDRDIGASVIQSAISKRDLEEFVVVYNDEIFRNNEETKAFKNISGLSIIPLSSFKRWIRRKVR